MATAETDTQEMTRAGNGGSVPTRFTPRFWQDADNRVAIVRALKERVGQLKTDSNADSMQKEVLCERAVFLIAVLETAEVNAVDGGKALDLGAYVQGVNSLMGVLRMLGLDKKAKAIGLADYVRGAAS